MDIKDMSVTELVQELMSREDVIAVDILSTLDIADAISNLEEAQEIELTTEEHNAVVNDVKAFIEDNWIGNSQDFIADTVYESPAWKEAVAAHKGSEAAEKDDEEYEEFKRTR